MVVESSIGVVGLIVELISGDEGVVVEVTTGGSPPPLTHCNSSPVAPWVVVLADAAITSG